MGGWDNKSDWRRAATLRQKWRHSGDYLEGAWRMGLRRALLSATLALTTIGALAVSAALAGDSYQTLQYSMRQHISESDAHTLGSILEAAKRGEPSLIRG